MPQVKSSYTADIMQICIPLQKSSGPYILKFILCISPNSTLRYKPRTKAYIFSKDVQKIFMIALFVRAQSGKKAQ